MSRFTISRLAALMDLAVEQGCLAVGGVDPVSMTVAFDDDRHDGEILFLSVKLGCGCALSREIHTQTGKECGVVSSTCSAHTEALEQPSERDWAVPF